MISRLYPNYSTDNVHNSLCTFVFWSLKFRLSSWRIPVTILIIFPLTRIRPNPRIATMLHMLTSMHNWTTLEFISILVPLLHYPFKGFITRLGRTSSGPTWTWSPNDLLDPHKIYENLLHHRSNDMDYLVARLVPISLRGTTEHPSSNPS